MLTKKAFKNIVVEFITTFLIALFAFAPLISYAQTKTDCAAIPFPAGSMTDRLTNLCEVRNKLIDTQLASTSGDIFKGGVQISMIDRQFDVADSYFHLKERIDKMRQASIRDPRITPANESLIEAEKIVYDSTANSFLGLDPTQDKFLDTDPFRPNDAFNQKEKEAINALNNVNRQLITPVRPGSTTTNNGQEGGVPEGDLIQDFIPGIIRLLFRFATLIILVSFIVSGVMFVASFGNDESLGKAKRILYYSLIGFAVLTLAFAIVQAITDIDFFGFV